MSFLFPACPKPDPKKTGHDFAVPKPAVEVLSEPPVEEKAPALLLAVPALTARKGRTRGKTAPGDGKLFNTTGMPQMVKVPANNAVHKIVQTAMASALHVTSATLQTFSGAQFNINQLDQVASLTAVFDQYRIARVEFWLMPRIATITPSVSTNTGLMVSVIDFDDAANLSSVNAGLDYTNALVGNGVEGHYRTWVPHTAIAAYSGAFTSFSNAQAPWIDAASPAVQHYGIKFGSTVTDVIYTYDAVWRLHTEWRNVR